MEIIAEIGWNHLGDMELASKMITSAKNSGATIAKFQLWDPEIMRHGDWDKDGRIEIYKKAKLDNKNMLYLEEICKNQKIEILFSAFGSLGAERLADLNFKSIKIPSHEINNKKLIDFCSKKFEKIYLSSGASNFEEVIDAVTTLNKSSNLEYFNLMHCVSSYPCEVSHINLPRLKSLKTIHSDIGLSDHTSSVVVPALSLSYGATVVEKHFTVDNNLEGRDNKFALNPDQFLRMVENINTATEATKYHGDNYQKTEEDIIQNYRGRWEPKDYL